MRGKLFFQFCHLWAVYPSYSHSHWPDINEVIKSNTSQCNQVPFIVNCDRFGFRFLNFITKGLRVRVRIKVRIMVRIRVCIRIRNRKRLYYKTFRRNRPAPENIDIIPVCLLLLVAHFALLMCWSYAKTLVRTQV